MLFSGLDPTTLVVNLIVLLIAMTIHEFAHSYVGWKMGDPTPARMGRLTLNPFVHINWVGWLMFALIGFGILGSAPISPYNMPRENRRWRWLAAVAAGPLSNLLLATIFALILRIVGFRTIGELPDVVAIFFTQMILLNILLFVFNLIPLFPIDGWQIVYSLLPPDLAQQWERHRMTTQWIFFGLLLLSFVRLPGIPNIFGLLISQPTQAIFRFLVGILMYRLQQGISALFSFAQPVDEPLAARFLPPPLLALFRQLTRDEQLHALNVLRDVLAEGDTPPELSAATLLHDVGKIRYTLTLWQRSFAVIVKAIAPGQWQRWSAGDPDHPIQRPFVVRRFHAQWSRELVEVALHQLDPGAALNQPAPRAALLWLVEHHQDDPTEWRDHPLFPLLQRLQRADDAN